MRDLSRDVKIVQHVVPAVYITTPNPSPVDRKGFESVTGVIDVGVGGITFTTVNKIEFIATHGDDTGAMAAVAAEDVVITMPDGTTGTLASGGIVRALTAAHAAGTLTKVAYKGAKRHFEITPTHGGTHATGTPYSVTMILGHAHNRPAGV